MGRGNEAAQSLYADRKAALDRFQDRNFDRLLALYAAVELLPGFLLVGFQLGKRIAVLAALGHNVNVDDVADFYDVFRRIRLGICKLLFKNRNVLLGVDGYPCLGVRHRDDGRRDDRTLLDILHVLQQGFHVLFIHI